MKKEVTIKKPEGNIWMQYMEDFIPAFKTQWAFPSLSLLISDHLMWYCCTGSEYDQLLPLQLEMTSRVAAGDCWASKRDFVHDFTL
jgi:hypothetical protein